jgi:hypothetical protein
VDVDTHRICGQTTSLSPFAITEWNPTDVAAPGPRPRFALLPNFPNPFNPATHVRYELAHREPVQITVYDVRGRSVRRLLQDAVQNPGTHEVTWNGCDDAGHGVASGVYILHLSTPTGNATRRAVLLK